ncbi:MAG: hypothetical protein HYT49_00800 [Candidatus Wildermuthbacteria bacterium]|nr:hypothetical protein [Candidatus Wildermuthbacteria bacterium]
MAWVTNVPPLSLEDLCVKLFTTRRFPFLGNSTRCCRIRPRGDSEPEHYPKKFLKNNVQSGKQRTSLWLGGSLKYRSFILQISSSQIKGFRNTQQDNQDNHDILNLAE